MKRRAIAWRRAAGDPARPAVRAQELHARARLSVKLLLARQTVIQALTLGAGIVLARMLAPAQFGLFVIVTFIVGASELIWISLLRTVLFVAIAVLLPHPFGFVAVAIAYLVAKFAVIPLYVISFGRGRFKRLLAPHARVCLPIGAGSAAGGALLLSPIFGAARSLAACTVVGAFYVRTAWLLPPLKGRRPEAAVRPIPATSVP